jgi:hypothetical protein
MFDVKKAIISKWGERLFCEGKGRIFGKTLLWNGLNIQRN